MRRWSCHPPFDLAVEGAAHGAWAAVEDVGVDLQGLDVLVAEQFLDGADVVAGFKEMGGEAAATLALRVMMKYARPICCIFHRLAS